MENLLVKSEIIGLNDKIACIDNVILGYNKDINKIRNDVDKLIKWKDNIYFYSLSIPLFLIQFNTCFCSI